MATPSTANLSVAARASAVLTTGEVSATALNLNRAKNGIVCVETLFTKGSLDSVDLRAYVSMDGTTYYPVRSADDGVVVVNQTADTNLIQTFAVPGYRFFRMSAQGTGTVTGSLLEINYRFLDADVR